MVALQARIKIPIPCQHPLMGWIVHHAAYLLNRYQLGRDGRTAWGRLHGKESHERTCELGENILWYVPKRLRSKLDQKWRYGAFLGRSLNSDQNHVVVADGSMVRARAIVRLVLAAR